MQNGEIKAVEAQTSDRLDESMPSAGAKRVLGGLEGELVIPDDFDAPLPDDVLAAFEGC